jgi:hypothetical protein
VRVSWGARARPGDVTVAWGLVSAGLLAMARWWPFDRWPLVTCALRSRLRVPCAACGMTRAFVRMVHGEVGAALRVSPLGAALCVGAMGFAAYVLLRLTVLPRGLRLETGVPSKWAARGAIALVATNWAYLLATGAAD